MQQQHSIKITRKDLEENTKILDICTDARCLAILEALYMKEFNPRFSVKAEDLQALLSKRRDQAPLPHSKLISQPEQTNQHLPCIHIMSPPVTLYPPISISYGPD